MSQTCQCLSLGITTCVVWWTLCPTGVWMLWRTSRVFIRLTRTSSLLRWLSHWLTLCQRLSAYRSVQAKTNENGVFYSASCWDSLLLVNIQLYFIEVLTTFNVSPQTDRRPELKRLISRVKRDQERERSCHENGQEDGAVKRFQLPKKYMQLEEFVKCIQESGIVKDQGTIHRLFDALTVGK